MPPSPSPACPRSFFHPSSCRSAVPPHPAGIAARWRAAGGARDSLPASVYVSVSEEDPLSPSRLHPLAAIAVGLESDSAGSQQSLDRPVHQLHEQTLHLTVARAQHRRSFGDLFVAALDIRHAATTARSAWISSNVRPSPSKTACLPVIAIHLWQMTSTSRGSISRP